MSYRQTSNKDDSFKGSFTTDDQADTVLISARASTYEMTAIEWLWLNRFAVGKLAIIAGLPDLGKGQIINYIIAQVTNQGRKWPMGEGEAPFGNVIMFSDEDAPSDTLVPRLKAAGADLDRVEIVKIARADGRDRLFNLVSDIEALRQKIKEVGNVRLITIDPPTAYLGIGKVNSRNITDVRAVLTPLAQLAEELKVAIICVMHFNKNTDVTDALLRISDSLAFGAVARHVYCVVADETNERNLFVRAKNNTTAKSKDKTLGFHFAEKIVGTDKATGKPITGAHICWEHEYVDVTATEAMMAASANRSPAARDAAKVFLLEMLRAGPMLKTEIEEAADANDISDRTLRRAKEALNVRAQKDGEGGKWRWHLPPQPMDKDVF